MHQATSTTPIEHFALLIGNLSAGFSVRGLSTSLIDITDMANDQRKLHPEFTHEILPVEAPSNKVADGLFDDPDYFKQNFEGDEISLVHFGNAIDGLSLYGPFKDQVDADEYATSDQDGNDYSILIVLEPLQPPRKPSI